MLDNPQHDAVIVANLSDNQQRSARWCKVFPVAFFYNAARRMTGWDAPPCFDIGWAMGHQTSRSERAGSGCGSEAVCGNCDMTGSIDDAVARYCLAATLRWLAMRLRFRVDRFFYFRSTTESDLLAFTLPGNLPARARLMVSHHLLKRRCRAAKRGMPAAFSKHHRCTWV